MRRVHVIVGVATVAAFLLSGQMLRLHHPPVRTMADGPRMMLISRHIYLLGAGLVNLALGLYLRWENVGWRRHLQMAGCVLVAIAPLALAIAFLVAPEHGVEGRSWWAAYGWFALFGGTMMHLLARIAAGRISGRIDTTASGL